MLSVKRPRDRVYLVVAEYDTYVKRRRFFTKSVAIDVAQKWKHGYTIPAPDMYEDDYVCEPANAVYIQVSKRIKYTERVFNVG